jgi:hypothetical protein
MPDELLPKLEASIKARDPQGSVRFENETYVTKFSALGAPQELSIRSHRSSSWSLVYKVTLPGAKERWFLESKGVWFPEHPGCRRTKVDPLDARFKMYASDPGYFRAVFNSEDLAGLLLGLPAGDHLKAFLKDEILALTWNARFDFRAVDQDSFLLDAADQMIRLGVQCFKGVQLARLTRGESTGFPREQS